MHDPHDPILEGTLHRVRAESARAHHRRLVAATAASATALTGVLLYGLHLGDSHRQLGAQLGDITLTATVTPSDGWIRVNATITGLREDERCHLVITDSHGRHFTAGGWVATRTATTLTGAASVPVADLAAITVVTTDGRVLITTAP